MLDSQINTQKSLPTDRYKLLNPLPKYFGQIQVLCKKVYPQYRPWSIEELESHRSYFPDGQLIVVDLDKDKVVGLAFSLIISWNDYSPQDSWKDYTSGGFFHNHDPKKGKTLYGAEVMVDPEYRGQGIGKLLYEGRRQIVEDYDLKRIRAGARIRGYFKYKDKLSPQEYVQKVVNKEISDPTLSFQLGQGFKVIDVASNYILDDPETLGYAAVIEWLNPKNVTPSEIKRQQQVVNRFLTEEKFLSEYLPKELRRLVRKATSCLGQAIKESEGDAFFKKIDNYRESLKKTRASKDKKNQLSHIKRKISKESFRDQLKIAHAFSLQLEIVNVCEAAYRSWKLGQKASPSGLESKLNLTYVLTAHPTEARSKSVIDILREIQGMLEASVHRKFVVDEDQLATLMRLLWLQPLSKSQKPTVVDEAEYIFSTVFEPNVFDFLLGEKPGYELKLTTWVGGDKDGHPGVDEKVMKDCLEKSRAYIVRSLRRRLNAVSKDLLQQSRFDKKLLSVSNKLSLFSTDLKKFQNLSRDDGTKLKVWKSKFNSYYKNTSPLAKKHYQMKRVLKILELFPGLVLPIELREDAEKIKNALEDQKSPIRKMLVELERVSGAMDITNYARGLVISHCESANDLQQACMLVDKVCKKALLPVIPLFETKEALVSSSKILTEWFKNRKNRDRVSRFWMNKFEVMLGYSDSAKQIGVLPSRMLISKSMQATDRTIRKHLFTPIFFHGSGGSVARGGGSIKEQISWWSYSAINAPKMTIQGEMIQRLFSSKEILNSQCAHLTRESLRRKTNKFSNKKNKVLEKLAGLVEAEYLKFIGDTKQLDLILQATPYHYLNVLKIGSRPSKRPSENLSLSALRAIPWVLCWTQARILLPSWWGIGSAWANLIEEEKVALKESFSDDKFLSSFVKTLGYTLEKVDLDVWEFYFDKPSKEILEKIKTEHEKAKRFVLEVSQEGDVLSHRPWMKESIYLRSPHIHILNLLQVEAIKRSDEALLKETIVGIACGMMTTG